MKRLERLQQDKENQQKEQAVFQAQQDKLALEADILETQRQVGLKEQELEALKNAPQLVPSNILAKQDELEGYIKGLKGLKDLKKELY